MVFSIPGRKSSAIFLYLIISLAPALSQLVTNGTSTGLNWCPHVIGTLSPNAPVNSTGLRSFRWLGQTQDWYLTMAFNDTRSPVLVSQMHDLQGYISAPADSDAVACVHMLGGLNATSGGGSGCDGVLSLECIAWLSDHMHYATRGSPSDLRCANNPNTTELRRVCGSDMASQGVIGNGMLAGAFVKLI
ncbi:hypothetical protein BKA63DRAFT_250237 [Paraphoma chrysanthemicola]|nr:hypothetical protein BKA63DRAFT_250237 [Paraphoma chrysanthemicola]